MKNFLILLKFEWFAFKADKTMLIFSLGLLLAGVYGIYYGNSKVKEQKAQIEVLDSLENRYKEDLIKRGKTAVEDAGNVSYYMPKFAKHFANKWASLALGQRDINPFYVKLRAINLHAQLYESENLNPLKVLSGNFDLSFVFVFLFPLFIISIGYNIISADAESGTLAIMLSQPVSLQKLILARLTFKGFLVIAMVIILSLIGIFVSQIAIGSQSLLWIALVITYCLFWFGIVFIIVSLQKNSSFNAVSLLGFWLVLVIIIPAFFSVYVVLNKPLPQGIELSIKQREEVHSGWDKDKEQTMQSFYKYYPQWKDTLKIRGRFEWRWYYAFHELADRNVADIAESYKKGLKNRHQLSSKLAYLSPPVKAMQSFNALAGTSLLSHIEFMESATRYHEQLKTFYYPYLFEFKKFNVADFSKLPKHQYTALSNTKEAFEGLIVLIITTFIAFCIGFISLKNKTFNRG